jgi:hypothetical protein
VNEIRPNLTPVTGSSKTESRLGQLLALLSVLNWFALFGVSMYFHGDAIGTLPSKDGFTVTSHGHHTPVTESEWLFSLFYGGFTLLATPAFWIIYGFVAFMRENDRAITAKRLLVVGFVILWSCLWFPGIGGRMYRSYKDWQNLKHFNTAPAPPPRIS